MNFNPQALKGYAPGLIYSTIGGNSMSYYRTGTGGYDPYGYLSSTDLAQVPGKSGKNKLTLKDVYLCCDYFQATVEPRRLAMAEEGYDEFLQAQYAYFTGRGWVAEAEKADDEFGQLVEPLLRDLSLNELSGMKVRTLENPLRCRAVSHGSSGVYVHPDWRVGEGLRMAFRNISSSVAPAARRRIHAWLKQNGQTLALPFEF